MQDETSYPQVISHVDAFTGANLELPLENKSHSITNQQLTEELRSHSKRIILDGLINLMADCSVCSRTHWNRGYLSWHNFSIGSTDHHTSIEAGSVMRLNNVSAISFICSNSTVVRSYRYQSSMLWTRHLENIIDMAIFDCKGSGLTLGTWEPIGGPTKGMSIGTQDGILLFMPNHGIWWSTISMTFLHVWRWLVSVFKARKAISLQANPDQTYTDDVLSSTDVPAGFRLYLSTSHKTNLLGSLRKGSLNIAEGMRYMSLLEPSDWYVLEPSKFHSGRSE